MTDSRSSPQFQAMSGVKFIGPAQLEFSSLQEQSMYFLNYYWPRWNDYKNPESYIIPPIFKYKNADISDEIFENIQKSAAATSKDPSAIINHRLADEAEHLVFDAIEELKNDGIQSPFICIQNLDLRLNENNGRLHGPLTEIFPDLSWDTLRQVMNRPNAEYDFILIGPKIGIIMIEVKSSQFKQSKHFNAKNRYLPDSYKDGLDQLESADAVLYFLETCTGIGPVDEVLLYKILFTPNLERKRFENWMASLGEGDKRKTLEKMGSTVQWFKENTRNSEEYSNKPPLYTALKIFLQETANAIHPRFYEAFVPVLAAMASMRALAREGQIHSIQINDDRLSECKAILDEHCRITEQNPTGSHHEAPKSLVKSHGVHTDIMFLTPDQQRALNGPSGQFIFGAAGTGKTIVLQAKALELLSKGESVVIVAPSCYHGRYKQLFDSAGFTNYRLEYPDKFQTGVNIMVNLLCESYQELMHLKLDEIVSWCLNGNDDHKLPQVKKIWFFQVHEHTIIDDASDFLLNHVPAPFAVIIGIAKRLSPNRLFWIAADSLGWKVSSSYATRDNPTLAEPTEISKCENRSVTFLRHVMRCSKNVFRTAYGQGIVWPAEIKPVLGHNIQGMRTVHFNQRSESLKTAMSRLANKTADIIWGLLKKGISVSDMAIIYDGNHDTGHAMLRNMIERTLQVQHMDEVSVGHYNLTLARAGENHSNMDGTLTFAHWESVSSYEWPIILTISICNKNDIYFYSWYTKYRTDTRATVMLIEIRAIYDEDDTKIKVASNNAYPYSVYSSK